MEFVGQWYSSQQQRSLHDGASNDQRRSNRLGHDHGITSVVQGWANGGSNDGFAFLSSNADGWSFYSSEFVTVTLRPYLTISYASPQLAAIDLDANNSSGATGSGFVTTWTENGGPVTIADLDATLTDADSTHLQSMTVTITNRLNGTLESLAANTSGTSITANYNSTTGELTLTGTDTVSNYQQVLRSITYNNSSEAPDTTARLITIQAADAFVQSNIATATINITAVNDAPVLDNSGNLTLATITEDAINNTGTQLPQFSHRTAAIRSAMWTVARSKGLPSLV